MNERIKELAKQADVWVDEDMLFHDILNPKTEKFAESIVRECVSIVAKRKDQAIDNGWNIDEAMSMAEMDLLEHFGVDNVVP